MIFSWIVGIYLILIFLIIISDILFLEIPNLFTFGLILLGLGYNFFLKDIESGLLGGSIYILPFLFLYGYVSDFLDRDVLGFGDIKFIFGMGQFLGYRGLYSLLIFLNITFLSALLYIILSCPRKKVFPFAPFLGIAGVTQFFLQEIYL